MRITIGEIKKIISEEIKLSRVWDKDNPYNKGAHNLKWSAHRNDVPEDDDEISDHLQDPFEEFNLSPVAPGKKDHHGTHLDPYIRDWGAPLMRH